MKTWQIVVIIFIIIVVGAYMIPLIEGKTVMEYVKEKAASYFGGGRRPVME